MAAGHDIYAVKDGTIPAQRQMLVDTGIAIGLPRGTYGRLAARSGMASKHGIAVGGRVIDVDNTSEIKVILLNHRDTKYEFKAGDRIAQLILEKIQTHDAMEIDNLEDRPRGVKGFGSTDIGPKRLITCEELKVKMCFLNPDPQDNSYFDEEDIHTHASLRDEITMVSSALIAAIQMQTMDNSFLDRIRTAGKEDDTWTRRTGELSQLKEKQQTLPKHWEPEDGLLYYKNRLFIPSNEEILTEIAKGWHDSKVAGHFGQEKTIALVTRNFQWEKLREWINDYVRTCDECQHDKSPRYAKYVLLQPLEVPYAAWTSVSGDFITQLPESQGQTQIMVVVDRFTKMAHFIGLETKATAKDVADTFLKEVWKLHGLPSEIVSDMDVKFSGEFGESLCKGLGIKRRMSTAYHPQTDGQTERTNQVLEGYLRNFVNYDQNDWYQMLRLAEYAYNNSKASAHKFTPFFANYGFHPQTEWIKEREAQNPGATMYTHWMKTVQENARTTLEQTREAMKKYYNQKAPPQPDIETGDLVMLNAKNIKSKRPTRKFTPRLYGPFKVLEKKGNWAFKHDIPARWKIHPVFHVSLLEPYKVSDRPNRE